MNADNMNPFLVVALLATLFTEAGRGDELAALAEKIRARTMRGGSEYWNCSRLEESRVSRNKFDGALVLQHTGMRYCEAELVSLSAENFLLAHFLFKQAWAGGVIEAADLAAASIDRYLSVTEVIQKYGTNRVFDQDSGKEFLVPIDRSILEMKIQKPESRH